MSQPWRATVRLPRGWPIADGSCSGEKADYLVRIVDGNDDPVIRLVVQVKDHGRLAPMTNSEGNAVKTPGEVPDGAKRAHGRPSCRHVWSVDLGKPVRDGSGADHRGPRHCKIPLQ